MRAGAPPLSLDLGVRVDQEAVDLRKAMQLYDAGKRAQAGALFARHDSLEARIGAVVQQLAGRHRRSSHPALGAAPEERRRATQPRDRAVLGGGERRRGRLEVGRGPRAGYGLRGHGRQPAAPGLRTQSADLRPDRDGSRSRFASSRHRPSWRCSSAGPARERPPTASSTASRCSDSASSARRSASTRRRHDGRRRTPRHVSPPPSASSTRPVRRRRSPTSVRSRAPSRMPPPCASTSGSCCSGRARSRRPGASSSSFTRPSRAPRSSASRSSTSTSLHKAGI